MSKIIIFGATSLLGSHFVDENKDYELVCYSRRNKNYNFLDLENETTFTKFSVKNSFLVSFAPIWLFKNLFISLENLNLREMQSIKGIIIYSSTSAITKRFAANEFDKNLSKKLIYAEKKIIDICKKYSINCLIIRPTIIYGNYKYFTDKNFSKIINFFQKFPFCIIPNKTGLRQPIHFSQLTKLTYFFLNKFKNKEIIIQIIEVGGDEELSYKDIFQKLANVATDNSGKNCKIYSLPNKIFYLFLMPLMILKPKTFDALYRLQSDLSGFPKYSFYSGENSKKFLSNEFNYI
tara:strand:+ start:755 stop:1630 length:876 start_codon:yes stop_codon:yes gene_type:complete